MILLTAKLRATVLLSTAMFVSSIGLAQTSQRLLDRNLWRSEPIVIKKVTANGAPVELGKRFWHDKSWLKGLTVTVQNSSNQAIAQIEINLSFPRPEPTSSDVPTYVVRLIYGLEPSDPSYSATQKPVLPGETAEVRLVDANLPFITSDLASLGYPEEITRARLTINTVTFMDGSTWAGGQTLYPDPANPNKKINPRLQREPTPPPDLQLSSRLEKVIFESVPRVFAHARNSMARPAVIQSSTDNCNTAFVTTQTNNCSDAGSGCTYRINVFDNSILLLGLFDSRSQLSSTRCQRSDGTFCTSTLISNFDRLPCAVRIAGTCLGNADWITYPTSGCITGLLFGGPCTRSSAFRNRCADPTGYEEDSCSCPDGINTSPIVVDVDHSGFSMTDAGNGVVFNILNDNVPLQLSWTAGSSTNAFLALDRNGNGRIDSGTELFGDITPQPPSGEPNGFLALAEYDKATNGGNGDGRITKQDSIFTQLLLWRDVNHNGISESSELRTIGSLLRSIDLDYEESKRTDKYGNRFRFRTKVYDVNGIQAGRWAWDVYLLVQ